MNDIYNYALDKSGFEMSTLKDLINMLGPGVRERFITALIGLDDYKNVRDGLRYDAVINDKKCLLVNYDYLTDTVYFTYEEKETRWFEDQKHADMFEMGGDYAYYGWYNTDETHTIESSHTFQRKGECARETWIGASL